MQKNKLSMLAVAFTLILALSILLPITYQPAQASHYVEFTTYLVGPTRDDAQDCLYWFGAYLIQGITNWCAWTGGTYYVDNEIAPFPDDYIHANSQYELDVWINAHPEMIGDYTIFLCYWCESGTGDIMLGKVRRQLRNTWVSDGAKIFIYQANDSPVDAWNLSYDSCGYQIQKLLGYAIGMPKCGVWWEDWDCNGKNGVVRYGSMMNLFRRGRANGAMLCGRAKSDWWWSPPYGCRYHWRMICENNGWYDSYTYPPLI